MCITNSVQGYGAVHQCHVVPSTRQMCVLQERTVTAGQGTNAVTPTQGQQAREVPTWAVQLRHGLTAQDKAWSLPPFCLRNKPSGLNAYNPSTEEEEEEEEEEVLDPLGIMRSKKPKKRPEVAVRPKPAPRLTIFDEEVDPDAGLFSSDKKVSETRRPLETTQDSLKLFDDPDLGGAVSLGDPLLLPAASESRGPTSRPEHGDASKELFRVEEDLDLILNLGSEPKPKPQTKPKPLVPAKPALPRKPTLPPAVGPSETGAGPQKQQQIQAMDEMDILQYIRDHDTLAQDSPSLF